MAEGSKKSRSFRRVHIRTPGGKTVMHYKRRKPKMHTCAECKAKLPGVPHDSANKIKNLPKSSKRPERPYGGVLCSRCMRKKFVLKAREATNIKK
jgi:large subunit ribosomal protein L34e